MSQIDVIRESVEYEQLLREDTNELPLRGEFLIPDTHPDVQEIISVDAKTIINSKESMGDRISIDGTIEYLVLYLAREEDGVVVNSVSYSDRFNSYIEALDSEHRVSCEANCIIEHIEGKIINERKVAIEGNLMIKSQCYKNSHLDFLKDVTGLKDVQILKSKETIDKISAKKELEISGKGTLVVGMDKPQIGKILKASINLHKKDVKLYEDRVGTSCFCKVDILYRAADGRELVTLEDDIYINREEEVIGVTSDMIAYADFNMVSNDVQIREDDLGETRNVDFNVLTRVDLKVVQKEEVDFIKDAYSPSTKIELSTDEAKIGIVQGQEMGEVIVKDNITLTEDMPEPVSIISTKGNVLITNNEVTDGKILIEGIVKAEVIYKTDSMDKEVIKIKGEIPFKTSLDIANALKEMKGIVSAFIENIQASIEGATIAIKATVSTVGKVIYNASKKWVSALEMVEDELQKKVASIIIYVIQAGDTLWSLAKKYSTTVMDLVKLNDLDEKETLKPGCKLLIPGRAII